MRWKITLTKPAKADFLDAVEWYTNTNPDLGKRFEGTMERVFKKLLEIPFGFQVVFEKNQVRRIPVSSFPYSIFYTIEESEDNILIWGIVHNRRNPKHWKDRSV